MGKKKKIVKKKSGSAKPKRKATPARKKVKSHGGKAGKKKMRTKAKKQVKKVVKKALKKVVIKAVPKVTLKPIQAAAKPIPNPITAPAPLMLKKKAPRKPALPPVPPPPPPPPLKKVITIVRSQQDKKKPDPPGKYVLEYIIHSPIAIIFEMISSPSGLSEWFADDVTVKEGAFVFYWDGIPTPAKMVNYKDDRLVRFQWEGKGDGKYFEFRLQTDELTNEVSLFVTDFIEEGADLSAARLLWDKQISNLKHVLGS